MGGGFDLGLFRNWNSFDKIATHSARELGLLARINDPTESSNPVMKTRNASPCTKDMSSCELCSFWSAAMMLLRTVSSRVWNSKQVSPCFWLRRASSVVRVNLSRRSPYDSNSTFRSSSQFWGSAAKTRLAASPLILDKIPSNNKSFWNVFRPVRSKK